MSPKDLLRPSQALLSSEFPLQSGQWEVSQVGSGPGPPRHPDGSTGLLRQADSILAAHITAESLSSCAAKAYIGVVFAVLVIVALVFVAAAAYRAGAAWFLSDSVYVYVYTETELLARELPH